MTTEQGFAAQTFAVWVLQLASYFGIPAAATHTIISSIVRAGLARRWTSVHWDLTFEIVFAWVLTLPARIIFGWLFDHLFFCLKNRINVKF